MLHRVSPVNDPVDTEREAAAICQACMPTFVASQGKGKRVFTGQSKDPSACLTPVMLSMQACMVGRCACWAYDGMLDGSTAPRIHSTATNSGLFWAQVVDKEAGADRKRMLRTLSSQQRAGSCARARFEQGSVDEISFLGAFPFPFLTLCPRTSLAGAHLRCI